MARSFPLPPFLLFNVMARLVRATYRGSVLVEVARTIPRSSRGRAMTIWSVTCP
jgi:hypothetical protein